MEYILRKAVRSDLPRINELVIEMFRSITGEENPKGYKPGTLDYYFEGKEDWICTAEIDGQVEAFLSIEVHHDQGDYLYFDDFCVSEKYRGMGIGTAMTEEAESFARKIDATAIALHVEKSNLAAKRLYEKLGFQVAGERDSRHLMIKNL